jgi:hypothetical protein
MPYPDLFIAAKHCQAMREFIILRMGGKQDGSSLSRLREMARQAAASVNDAECDEFAGAIVALATDLFSDTGHAKWAHGRTSGADFLRLRILREISALQNRLAAIESDAPDGGAAWPACGQSSA